ncbi:hypothetical protein QJS10_CPB12g00899 [Acorus calamus]|uniref:Reverse transcriptase zinc-binding domain-containing protein n=1 Tax=Acorus calamus TaxID=4465 RepID=A0AAV9DLU4_ACOCL|nr:hypothetical protein QJS10_CPB12g00899 [Acorus calamus]
MSRWCIPLRRSRLSTAEASQLQSLADCLAEWGGHFDSGPDRPWWQLDPTHGFTVKGCYDRLRRGILSAPLACGSPLRIWRLKIPMKIKVFMWLLAKERLLTRDRAKWRSDSPVECGLCGEAPESIDHLFSQCRVTSAFWRKVCSATSLAPFHSLQEMWEANEALRIRSASRHARHVSSLIIPAGTWVIWRTRNDAVFNNTSIYVENMWEFMALLVRD